LYNGAYLPTLDINTLDSVETAIIKIESYTTTLAAQAGDYTEWAAYTGTRVGGDLITVLGETTTITINEATQTIGLNGNVSSVDTLTFDIAAAPIASAPGQMHWNSLEDTLDLHANNVTYQIGQEIAPLVRNQTGSTITNGTPVMFAGTLGASGRILVTPAIADGSIPSSYILGAATEDITSGQDGHVTWFGKVRDIDTTGTPYGETWADQDILYVSPTTAGFLTNVKPSAPNSQIFVGVVINTHATQGTLFIRPSWRGNLTDLADINGTPLTVDGQILVWNQSNGYFDPTSNISDFKLISPSSYVVSGLAALTLTEAHADGILNMAGNASTLTVPPNATTAFPIGTKVTVLYTDATGVLTFAQGAGVTINTALGGLTRASYTKSTLIKVGTDVWILG
jgi:hypothetical protein